MAPPDQVGRARALLEGPVDCFKKWQLNEARFLATFIFCGMRGRRASELRYVFNFTKIFQKLNLDYEPGCGGLCWGVC